MFAPLSRQTPQLRPRFASSRLMSRRPAQGDDLERQDVNGKHSRHRSGTFDGKATPLLMSHKVMFVVLGAPVSLGVLARV